MALLYTDFQGTALDASGKTIEVRSKALEVLRRQPDGAWKLINGREREAGMNTMWQLAIVCLARQIVPWHVATSRVAIVVDEALSDTAFQKAK